MSIRIRIYPQVGSYGYQRVATVRRQRTQLRMQTLQFARQQALLRQQAAILRQSMGYGVGFGARPYGSTGYTPAGPWGYGASYGSTSYPTSYGTGAYAGYAGLGYGGYGTLGYGSYGGYGSTGYGYALPALATNAYFGASALTPYVSQSNVVLQSSGLPYGSCG